MIQASSMDEVPPAVQMIGIVKRFPGVLANDQVDFTVHRGQIHALLGENGAGKSTLMNILIGLYQPDEGSIRVSGERVRLSSPRDAIRHGIGMVHQHFMLVPTQTVTENLILGQSEPRFFTSQRKLDAQVLELSRRYGLEVEPTARIWQLSVGEQQRVEVLKMLYHGAKILIMDEPTAVLTPQEVTSLFKTLRSMVSSGHSVVFISHKLDEVLEIADVVTVMRRGRVVDSVEAKDTDKSDLARRMVGREVLFRVEKAPADPGEPLLVIQSATCENDRGLPALQDFSLEIRAGEILGLAGVAGNGQTELAQVITGLRPLTAGEVTLKGFQTSDQPVTTGIDHGLAYIPADRTGVGSAPNLSVSDNLMLKTYRHAPVSKGWAMDAREIRRQSRDMVERFDVKTPSIETPSRMLSGGNLQKLILAREFSQGPSAIVAVYPSRGLDVGATENVHDLLIQERDSGAAVLLISEDLDELLSLSDRIAVIYEGRIVGEVPPEDERVEEIGLMMAGSSREVEDAPRD